MENKDFTYNNIKSLSMKSIVLIFSVLMSATTFFGQTQKSAQSAPAKTKINVEIRYNEARQFYYIYDLDNKKLVKALPYKKVNDFCEDLAMIETKTGVGFINQTGKEIVAPNGKYTWARDFSGGLACVGTVNENGESITAGFINKTGALAIPLIFQNANSFSEGLAQVKKNGKWGYINKTGTMIIPAIYENSLPFKYGMAAVSKEVKVENDIYSRYGYIDKTGKQIIAFKYDEASNFRSTGPDSYTAIVIRGFVPYFIDKKGNEYNTLLGMPEKTVVSNLIWADDDGDDVFVDMVGSYSARYTGVYSCFASSFRVKPDNITVQTVHDPVTNRKFYMINKYGKFGLTQSFSNSIYPAYDHIQFADSLIYAFSDVKVENNKVVSAKISLFDLKLNSLSKYKYESVKAFSENMAFVKRDGKVGFINRKGEEVIQPVYDDAGMFLSGLVSVLKDGKVGVLNKKGEVIIPFEYENIGGFFDGLACYNQNGKFGIMDSTGKKVTEATFEGLGDVSEGMLAFIKDKKIGFINTKGEIVIQPQFDFANPFYEGLAMVALENKVGFIDKQGNFVIPCKYENSDNFQEGYTIAAENGKFYLIDKKGTVIKAYESE